MLSRAACKYGFCVLVCLSCVVFLIFATYENARHGPHTVSLSVHLSSFTFKELNLGTSRKLDTVWNTSIAVFAKNPEPWASFNPTRGSFAFVKYGGVGISCGELVEDGEELPMGVGNVSSLQFKSKPCDFPNQIDDDGLGARLRSDLDRKEHNASGCLREMDLQLVWFKPHLLSDDFVVSFTLSDKESL
ncbi:hypothetical protein POTOM_013655 [Populus tomentosa]|uniref:Uncharacterized protein n=1 Tax=Populus tomentosa TaxID=118781 RepID=A0A8X8A591_POPTO|nr:hypothetical protein POTOM_013655 [Populus tomentosa]